MDTFNTNSNLSNQTKFKLNEINKIYLLIKTILTQERKNNE